MNNNIIINNEETPTRRNTTLNSINNNNDDDEENEKDEELKGPLRLAELPGIPSNDTNFSIEALTAKLAYIVDHPEINQPAVMRTVNHFNHGNDTARSNLK